MQTLSESDPRRNTSPASDQPVVNLRATIRPQLQRAIDLWALGISVIPLHHPGSRRKQADQKRVGKVPLVSWEEYQTRRCTGDELHEFFDVDDPRNVGLVMGRVSGLIGIDIDSAAAKAVAERLLPATPMRTRTAKGEHWLYRYPKFASEQGYTFKNRVRVVVDGAPVEIDVRADGGYLVGPGSVHASGVEYEAIGGIEQWARVLNDVPVLEPSLLEEWSTPKQARHSAPRAPLALVSSPSPLVTDGREQARRYLSAIPGAVEGCGGDDHTFTTVCKVVRGFNLSDGDAFEVLSEWNARCSPPWSDDELRAKIDGAHRYGSEPLGGRMRIVHSRESVARKLDPDSHDAPGVVPAIFPLTDSGNAEFFAQAYGDRVRYDHRRAKWLVWGGHTWTVDADEAVLRYVKEAMRRRQMEVAGLDDVRLATAFVPAMSRKEALNRVRSFEDQSRLFNCVTQARKEPPIADRGDGWDSDPWLIGCPNGVVDLRTGALRPGTPADRITMRVGVAYDPQAPAPRWERFVTEIFGSDTGMAEWLQRAVGYSLTADRAEQCFFLCYGTGSNGKSTLLDMLSLVFGDYARSTPFSTLEMDRKGGIPNDVAALAGKRFVTSSETNENVRFNEARVKSMTGDRSLDARFLHGEWFSFTPVMKLWLAVNHRPVVRDDSTGFWRRMHLIPFEQSFQRNPKLAGELEAEAAGILAWAVRGALAWQQARGANGSTGLEQPGKIREAVQEYRADSDHLQAWLDARCVRGDGMKAVAKEMHDAYRAWADEQGMSERERLNITAWGRKMADKGLRKGKDGRGRTIYLGIGLSESSTLDFTT